MPLHSVVTSGSAVAALLSNLATRIEGFGLLLGARCSLEGRYTQEARDPAVLQGLFATEACKQQQTLQVGLCQLRSQVGVLASSV